jgi:hypothetical protein
MLGEGLNALGIEGILRVKGSPNVCVQGPWRKLQTVGFAGHNRHRHLGRVAYGESAPPRLGVTLSRARDTKGQGESW